MTSLNKESLTELSTAHAAPCLSLYQPTHRRHPQNQQDRIRYGNLVKQLETSLLQTYSEPETRSFLRPFEALKKDDKFWNHTLDGLVVLSAPDLFRVFRVPRSVAEFTVVANSFHLKPLWKFLQSVDRFQVLGLSLDRISLFEGDRYNLEEIELNAEVPGTIEDALGSELTDSHHHGGRSGEINSDTNRFFRSIDQSILDHYSRPSQLPLLLAALPEHHHLFRSISQNPFLADEGIMLNPKSVTKDELRARAWNIFQPHYEAKLTQLADDFEQAMESGMASENLHHITEAAISGRVATLFIEANRQIPGRIDEANRKFVSGVLDNAQTDDALDDIGELVGKKGGEVLVIAATKMPTQRGLAAIYRY